jgi:rhamnogalacturonyl hydrolase YesR
LTKAGTCAVTLARAASWKTVTVASLIVRFRRLAYPSVQAWLGQTMRDANAIEDVRTEEGSFHRAGAVVERDGGEFRNPNDR